MSSTSSRFIQTSFLLLATLGTVFSSFLTENHNTIIGMLQRTNVTDPVGVRATNCSFIIIRGYLKEQCSVNGTQYYKCPFTDHYYRVTRLQCRIQEFSTLCPRDDTFYQSCGHIECSRDKDHDQSRNEAVCGEALCEWKIENIHGVTLTRVINFMQLYSFLRCDGISQCRNTVNNTAVDEKSCEGDRDAEGFYCAPCTMNTSMHVTKITMAMACDGVCDCPNCYDEARCGVNSTLISGMICKVAPYVSKLCGRGNLEFVGSKQICDGKNDCLFGQDEKGCNPNDTCIPGKSIFSRGQRMLHERNKCSIPDTKSPDWPQMICKDYHDQMNCSTVPSPLTCNVSGYPTKLSEHVLCKGLNLCDDDMDSSCVSITKYCVIHKHRMCDGVANCPNKSDEEVQECRSMTSPGVECMRRLSYVGHDEVRAGGAIPSSWILDGMNDCIGGEDEDEDGWSRVCGTGDDVTYSFRNHVSCGNTTLLKCPQSDNSLAISRVCTGYTNCDRSLCVQSRRDYKIYSSAGMFAARKRTGYCYPGLGSLEHLAGACSEVALTKVPRIYGVTDQIILLSQQYSRRVSCQSIFGELYVYLVCSEQYDSHALDCVCPLSHIPHTACRNIANMFQFYTITEAGRLTVAFRESDGTLGQNVFGCKNGQCIAYDKVCNLMEDCDDSSDEAGCSNNFRCLDSGEYIPIEKMCDGVFDCLDYSDECNDDCDNQVKIFHGRGIFIVALVLGLTATVLNIGVIYEGVKKYRTLRTAVAMINESFVLVVSSGDLLQGVFILLVAVSDEVINTSTCKTQLQWVTNAMCTFLGVISTIGSLVSLYSMTILSLLRASGLRSMNVPREGLSHKQKTSLICGVCGIYLLAIIVAVLPTLEILESYFVQTVKFDDNPLFVGGLDKPSLVKIIKAYYGRFSAVNLPWYYVDYFIDSMFVNRVVRGDRIGFYGSNGLCLFNYFVRIDNPQIWISGGVLISNMLCVSTIAICYGTIHVMTKKSINLAGKNNRALVDRNKKIQRNISILIFTDILSWVPFFGVWLIHISEVLSTAGWHSIFSIIILPLNSILNPVLILEAYLKKYLRAFGQMIKIAAPKKMNSKVSPIGFDFEMVEVH